MKTKNAVPTEREILDRHCFDPRIRDFFDEGLSAGRPVVVIATELRMNLVEAISDGINLRWAWPVTKNDSAVFEALEEEVRARIGDKPCRGSALEWMEEGPDPATGHYAPSAFRTIPMDGVGWALKSYNSVWSSTYNAVIHPDAAVNPFEEALSCIVEILDGDGFLVC